MWGAIIGDIAGSVLEGTGRREPVFVENEIFSRNCRFTDDMIMTIAITDALMSLMKEGFILDDPDTIHQKEFLVKNRIVEKLKYYGNRYLAAGYGGGFFSWLQSKSNMPYGSFGNGSAMRVSGIGYMFNSLYVTMLITKWSAEVTHNHIDGVYGAMAIVLGVYLLRNNVPKEDVMKILNEFYINKDINGYENIRKNYEMDATCAGSVPESLLAFFKADNFKETILNAISFGGDTDTMGAIAGALAESYYEIPKEYIEYATKKLINSGWDYSSELLRIVKEFEDYKIAPNNTFNENEYLDILLKTSYKNIKNTSNYLVLSDLHNTLEENDFNEKIKEIYQQNITLNGILLLGDIGHGDWNILYTKELFRRLPKFAVLGNHDSWNDIKRVNDKILYLSGRNNGYEYPLIYTTKDGIWKNDNITFAGLDGSLAYNNEKNKVTYTEKTVEELLKKIPQVNVLVSHSNKCIKKHWFNFRHNETHQGFMAITKYLRTYKDTIHIHGHLHKKTINDNSYCCYYINLLSFNVSEMDENFERKVTLKEFI